MAMIDNKVVSSVLEAFDGFLCDVNNALAFKNSIEEENRALRLETEQLTSEAKRKDEIISNKEDEITRLLDKNLVISRSQFSKVKETKAEIRASVQLVEMKYEVRLPH